MNIYLVGGAVRNKIMGLPAKDNDYVVVGATKEEMIANDFTLVGQEFPVFLKNGEEYALARREKSTGNGYHDFEVSFGTDVTLEEDLQRRDFTMNAIAEKDGEYVDPFNGIEDIHRRIIRHINPQCFADDPVRVLRLARFAAQYPSFKISDETKELASRKYADISHATPERVAKEMEKALMGPKPSLFFDTLRELNHLDNQWFSTINSLIGQTQPIKYHAEGDAYTHTMMVLDSAAKYDEPLVIRFACLTHDFGKAFTPKSELPKHIDHEKRGVPHVNKFCDTLKLSNELKRVAVAVTEFHMLVHKITKMRPKTIVKYYDKVKKYYREIASVGFHDNNGRLPYRPNLNHKIFQSVFACVENVKLDHYFSPSEISAMEIPKIKEFLRNERVKQVKSFFRNWRNINECA